jgi:hypothetical protein
VPLVLTVHPNDEALGEAALELALAACTLPVWERWVPGDRAADGSIVCWSGFSIRLSDESFATLGAATHAAVTCLDQKRAALAALRDCPAVRGMTLFLHLSYTGGTGVRARLPRRLTEVAGQLRVRIQVHAADGSPIA